MKFELENGQHGSVLTLKGENLNSEIVPGLKSQIIFPANTSDSSNLITDSERVLFADFSGLSALLMAQRFFCDSEDRMMFLCNLIERMRKLFEISGLYHIFCTAGNREAAMEYPGGNTE